MHLITTLCLFSLVIVQANPLEVSIKNLEGKAAKLADHAGSKATVVVFMQFECPISSEYGTELARLATFYSSKGVNFIGVIPNSDEDAELKKDAREYKIGFPVLHDAKLILVDALGAKITPEVFLLDSKGAVVYSGRVDDSWTERLRRNVTPKKKDLVDAIESYLANKELVIKKTDAVGCPISRPLPKVAEGKVTYHRDIAPIIQEKCQACHRPGEVAPFSLTSFNDAVRWKDLLVEVVEKKQMPPWLPSGGLHYRGERRMSDAETSLLRNWVKGGCAEGDFANAPLPKRFTEGWQLGEPDLILEASEDMVLAGTGKDLFRCMVLPTNLTEDKIVVAYEFRPGNRRVVHHTLHYLDKAGKGRDLQSSFKKFIDYVVGNSSKGTAFKRTTTTTTEITQITEFDSNFELCYLFALDKMSQTILRHFNKAAQSFTLSTIGFFFKTVPASIGPLTLCLLLLNFNKRI